ncbi:MAG: hypothetical protein CMM85_20740 [Rhodothermaceae bacterium]|nr:hypothetical protein [Rhodothermaceae bacterium]
MAILASPDPPPLAAGTRLTVTTVGRLLEPAFELDQNPLRDVVLDLRAVQFVTPYALAALATQIEAAHDRGRMVRLLCPARHETLLYLAVSGFFSQVRSRADVVGPTAYVERGPTTAKTVLPLTRIENNDDVDRALGDVRALLRQLARDGDWFKRFRNLVVELCGNIFRHAEVQVGYVVAQRYASREGPFIELAIGDAGQGVIGSLARVHPRLLHLDPAVALRTAVRDRLSSRPDDHGGNGFHGLHKVATERQGRFVLRSGGARVSASRGATALYGTTRARCLQGTQVMVTVDCD